MACFRPAFAPILHGPRPPIPLSSHMEEEAGRQVPEMGRHGHTTTSILGPFAPMAFFLLCAYDPFRGLKVRLID